MVNLDKNFHLPDRPCSLRQ